jgi:lipopolysaccharide biosynthesis glycosyltransferase
MSCHSCYTHRSPYGIYTLGDHNFFAGIVASINALRFYGYIGPIAVIDIGFEEWMQDYLESFSDVSVLSIEPAKKDIRFTDVRTDESPIMKNCAYKAFGILHYNIFERWTYIDGDYFPLCNLEAELRPLIEAGLFVSTEDGTNTWEKKHQEASGVMPGTYMNINAGFVSLDMKKYAPIVHEWRNLMTRRKPFGHDQAALNAILDKWNIAKHVLDKVLWNQTWLNEAIAKEKLCRLVRSKQDIHVWYEPKASKIMGWHGTGPNKLWHQLGIDHYRKNSEERLKFYEQCQGIAPSPILEIFEYFLFMSQFNRPLKRNNHLLMPLE